MVGQGPHPGRPLFPGALRSKRLPLADPVDYSAHRLDGELGSKFVGFGGVENARFRGSVEPECTCT
ncbi:MAG: hypothetical protein R3F17_03835 [Planctomycetota bacterium]